MRLATLVAGRWGIPFNPLPYGVEYVVGVGRPIDTTKYRDMEDQDEAIELVMALYIAEVRHHKDEVRSEERSDEDVELERRVYALAPRMCRSRSHIIN